MANISDIIERFLLDTLGDNETLNISRNELANYFSCAPSQINYVLSTRFTPDRGYVIESRRGGGGYITVVKVSKSGNETIEEILNSPISDGISYNRAAQILERLTDSGIITAREARLIESGITDRALIAPTVAKDGLRAGILKSVICQLLKDGADA